ncbi:hypothetical protein HDIA_4149 [Hartmannibacter diazotrophicus]|uniref:Uncharacterized protein n=1 Tax=Hartmannibacter diazotrophicus TaxID=1482074 RepID=A0A2C9DBZ2_9HYPH|nr:hypothetical protein HDIA_4149 [Hartmannibacter diazotrophicus]
MRSIRAATGGGQAVPARCPARWMPGRRNGTAEVPQGVERDRTPLSAGGGSICCMRMDALQAGQVRPSVRTGEEADCRMRKSPAARRRRWARGLLVPSCGEPRRFIRLFGRIETLCHSGRMKLARREGKSRGVARNCGPGPFPARRKARRAARGAGFPERRSGACEGCERGPPAAGAGLKIKKDGAQEARHPVFVVLARGGSTVPPLARWLIRDQTA